jgi:protein-S-isoprenylcysteine O-methyltransferase Ste14
MTDPTPLVVCLWAWMAFIAFWLVAGAFANRTRQAESRVKRLTHTIPLALGCYLILFRGHARPIFIYGELYRTGWSDAAVYVGLLLTGLGMAVAIWARIHLGRYWSGIITLKEGHRLIMSGPYGRVRHPIYTGWLLALLGTALANATADAFVALALVTFAFVIKMRREEQLLAENFPEEFPQFKHDVPAALIPMVF